MKLGREHGTPQGKFLILGVRWSRVICRWTVLLQV